MEHTSVWLLWVQNEPCWKDMKKRKLLYLRQHPDTRQSSVPTIRSKAEGEDIVKEKYYICSCYWHMGRTLGALKGTKERTEASFGKVTEVLVHVWRLPLFLNEVNHQARWFGEREGGPGSGRDSSGIHCSELPVWASRWGLSQFKFRTFCGSGADVPPLSLRHVVWWNPVSVKWPPPPWKVMFVIINVMDAETQQLFTLN